LIYYCLVEERYQKMNDNKVTTVLFAVEGVGAVFVGLFLAAYLGGLFVVPQTTVFHSIPEVKLALGILGGVLLVLILVAVVLAILERKIK
jgi:hypothetical protein